MHYIIKYTGYNYNQGRKGKTSVKQVSFHVFPEGCDRGTGSYLERERVPKNCGLVHRL